MKIYTNLEAVPSRILALIRILLGNGSTPEKEVIALLQPREGSPMAKVVLGAACELGLVEKKAGTCKLAEGHFLKKITPSNLEEYLPSILATILLQEKVGDKMNGFSIICAWILQQPLLKFPSDRLELKNALIDNGYTLEELQVQNDARWDNIIYWAKYLGLLRQFSDSPSSNVVPDPTEFLRNFLPELLPAGEEVEIREFRTQLGKRFPVMDGGSLANAVQKKINSQPPENRLSNSLAFALTRLELSNQVEILCSDDWKNPLLFPDGRKIAFLKRA